MDRTRGVDLHGDPTELVRVHKAGPIVWSDSWAQRSSTVQTLTTTLHSSGGCVHRRDSVLRKQLANAARYCRHSSNDHDHDDHNNDHHHDAAGRTTADAQTDRVPGPKRHV